MVRMKLPSPSALNSVKRPLSCESQLGPPGSTPDLHCAIPSTAFGVKPDPWTVTCCPSANGPPGVVVIVGGGATAVGSKPSGTSATTSGSSIDCTRTTHAPTELPQLVSSAMMITPPDV